MGREKNIVQQSIIKSTQGRDGVERLAQASAVNTQEAMELLPKVRAFIKATIKDGLCKKEGDTVIIRPPAGMLDTAIEAFEDMVDRHGNNIEKMHPIQGPMKKWADQCSDMNLFHRTSQGLEKSLRPFTTPELERTEAFVKGYHIAVSSKNFQAVVDQAEIHFESDSETCFTQEERDKLKELFPKPPLMPKSPDEAKGKRY